MERLQGVKLSEFLDIRNMKGARYEHHAPAAFTLQEIPLVLISIRH
jgi:hypothetical protein